MTRDQVKQAAVLNEALRAIDEDLAGELDVEPGQSWHYRGMRIVIADLQIEAQDIDGTLDGVNHPVWCDIDNATARIMLPLLRETIVTRLRDLGVEI